MDLHEYVADNDRYAFLLGSALRNNDSEQFFCIYDSIIPKDLTDVQVEKIKEKSRLIADLPEDDFNELVLNARDFSLARGRPPLSPFLAMSTSGQDVLSDHSDEDECQIHRYSKVTDLNCVAHGLTLGYVAAGITDDDSGLPSSTKTGRPASLSSDDTTETEDKDQFKSVHLHSNPETRKGMEQEEEKVEVPRLREMVVVSHSYNPEYDEEVPVEHDDESVESPRSDASSTREYDVTQLDGEDGTEMTTFSSEQHGYYDEDDSDENFHRLSCLSRDSRKMTDCLRPANIQFTQSCKLLAEGKTISSLRNTSASTTTSTACEVDEPVNFPLWGSPSHPSRYSPDCEAPPFGTGKDLLDKVGESVSSLVEISSSKPNRSSADTVDETADGKKKQKQKKSNKDDGTQEGGHCGKKLTRDTEKEGSYLMRDKNSVLSGSGRPGLPGTDNHEMGHTQGEDIASSQNGRPRKRNKKNARQQGIEVHPDQDKSYVGNISNVDLLVDYINNRRSVENVKENLTESHPGFASASRVKASKRKERNRIRISEISGIESSDRAHTLTSDTDLTLMLEDSVAEETESENRFSRPHAEGKKEMGNSLSSEKIDTSEVETPPSSFKTSVIEAETNKEAALELVKGEAATDQQNHLSNSKNFSTLKQTKNDDKDSAKTESRDQVEAKTKSSRKGKSTTSKKDSQKPEIKKKLLPSSPATPEVDVDNSQEQWCTVLSKPQKKKKRSQGQTVAMGQNGYTQ